MRRCTAIVPTVAKKARSVPHMTHQTRNLEIMSTYWLASWAMMWQWNFFTFFPLLIMDLSKPSVVVNKVPLLHYFEEKRQEAKLQRFLDETVTLWSDELDMANIDSAISRTF